MKKEKKLELINALIKEAKAWPILPLIPGVKAFIKRAQLVIENVMGPQSHYIKDIDAFSDGKSAIDFDIIIIEALRCAKLEIEMEAEDGGLADTNSTSKKLMNKPDGKTNQGKIFISHSSRDSVLVGKFVDYVLLLGLELKREEIFCTSIDGMGIKSGEDFKEAIIEELRNAKAVIQIITKNYKTSEVCLNEMGAAWLAKSIVIPLVAAPFNYDVGFIHASSQQLKLNEEKDLIKFYDDHKESLFKAGIKMANYLEQIKAFIGFLKKHVEKENLKRKFTFFYHEKNRLSGKLYSDVFGHPPMEEYEDSKSFHRFYYIIPESPINVLSGEMFIKQGNFNVSKFNVEKIQIAPVNLNERIDLKQLDGRNIEVTGKFMGAHTAWHRTDVLLFYEDVREIN